MTVNADSIRLLLEEFTIISEREPFFFLSGRYGRPDGSLDPINDYAVRQHWFFPPDAQPGDPRFSSGTDRAFVEGMEASRTFLADLAVLGAQQPMSSPNAYSVNLRAALPPPSVISGIWWYGLTTS